MSARACKAQLFTCVRGLLNIYRRCLDGITDSKVYVLASSSSENIVAFEEYEEYKSDVPFDNMLSAMEAANGSISVAMRSLGAEINADEDLVASALSGAQNHDLIKRFEQNRLSSVKNLQQKCKRYSFVIGDDDTGRYKIENDEDGQWRPQNVSEN